MARACAITPLVLQSRDQMQPSPPLSGEARESFGSTREALGSKSEKPSSRKGLVPLAAFPERFASLANRSDGNAQILAPPISSAAFTSDSRGVAFFDAGLGIPAMARDGRGKRQPLVLGHRPDGSARRREIRVGKAAGRDADHVGHTLGLPEDVRAAGRAEVEGQPVAAVALAAESTMLAGRRDKLAFGKEGRRAEHGAGSALARLAMTGRDELRIARKPEPELAAMAGRFAFGGLGHGRIIQPNGRLPIGNLISHSR